MKPRLSFVGVFALGMAVALLSPRPCALAQAPQAQEKQQAEVEPLLKEILSVLQSGGEEGLRAWMKANKGRVEADWIVRLAERGAKERDENRIKAVLLLAAEKGDKSCLANVDMKAGDYHSDLSENTAAVKFYDLALRLYVDLGDLSGQGNAYKSEGNIYYGTGDQAKAQECYNHALPIFRAAGDRSGEAKTLHNIGNVYWALDKLQKALEYYQQALAIERTVGDRALEALTLNGIGNVHSVLGEPRKALEYYQQALPIKRAVGDRAGEAMTLNNMGAVYSGLGERAKALEYYQQALPIERAVGDRVNEARTLKNIGEVYHALGEQAKALEYYQQALPIQRAVRSRVGEAATLQVIGNVYSALGEMAKALEYYQQALLIQRAVRSRAGEAATLSNIGAVYFELGEQAKALEYYRQALPIERAVGDRAAEAATLNNVGGVHRALGEQAKALEYFQQALLARRAIGDRSGEAMTLNNIGAACSSLGEQAKALEYFQQALPIQRAVGNRAGEAATLDNIGLIYFAFGMKAKALEYYQQALPIQRAVGDRRVEAVTLDSIGEVYSDLGKKARALEYFQQALPIRRAVGDRAGEAETLMNLGSVYSYQGKYGEAEPLFDQALEIDDEQLEQQFAYLSEKERLEFLDTISYHFPSYYSFCLTYHKKSPGLVGKMYDVVLRQKGLVVSSVAALRAKIEASGDREALTLLERLTAKKTQLAKVLTAQRADREEWRKSVVQIENEANDLEEELVRRSAALAEEKKLAHLTWRDVQKSLEPGEAAVEIVRFPFYSGKKWTERTEYVALIVTPERTTRPLLVSLGEAKNLEDRPLREYRWLVGPNEPRPLSVRASFYEAFWKPLEPALRGAKRIYFSPDGALSQVSLAVVPRSDGRLLVDDYDLRIVLSTKDLLREKHPASSDSAVLIGNPDFALTEVAQRAATQSLQKTEEPVLMASAGRGMRSRELGGNALTPLPGTATELKAVDTLLKNQNWAVSVYTEANALEELVKRVRSPRLLHLATHGFFEPDQKIKRSDTPSDQPSGMENPMLRSGLFFAGADRVLSGATTAPDLEDGVLTAYEATGMNLQGTELVILSACETGLGEAVAGEGVFGLRRALQVAGAEAVLMSMWPVPDQETQELMGLFYKYWMAGKSKPEALRQAQVEMREVVKARYGNDLPFYWGAFVLVGQ
jgi:tetratricopeptide (TPR) repeat protein/CHAT domain-containing protein